MVQVCFLEFLCGKEVVVEGRLNTALNCFSEILLINLFVYYNFVFLSKCIWWLYLTLFQLKYVPWIVEPYGWTETRMLIIICECFCLRWIACFNLCFLILSLHLKQAFSLCQILCLEWIFYTVAVLECIQFIHNTLILETIFL